MAVTIVGIDPGTRGVLAALQSDGVLQVQDLPVLTKGRGTRPELDLHSLHSWLAELGPVAHAFLEKVGPMPKQGTVSTFRFGESFGAVKGIVVAMGIAEQSAG